MGDPMGYIGFSLLVPAVLSPVMAVLETATGDQGEGEVSKFVNTASKVGQIATAAFFASVGAAIVFSSEALLTGGLVFGSALCIAQIVRAYGQDSTYLKEFADLTLQGSKIFNFFASVLLVGVIINPAAAAGVGSISIANYLVSHFTRKPQGDHLGSI